MRKTIYEGHKGLFWKKGKIIKVLEPGRHRYSVLLNEKVEVINVQEQEIVLETQQYTTKDNLIVRAAVRAKIAITDPASFKRRVSLEQNGRFAQGILNDLLRESIAKNNLDELLEQGSVLHTLIQESAEAQLAGLGVAVKAVSPISILIPRSLSQAFEAELGARKRAIADLEEARGRTATLRHLANAADLVEKRPVLLQLLIGQKARQVQFQFKDKEN
ncbi:hypothetical protein EYC58_02515 [Candidatus Saccharibacteria bacterium]|nr:MAG: hypothetical protein EYC58_02515 [Candidatus Saccharibacteria bacterium]